MRRFNLVGDNFTHRTGGNLGYSTHGKRPEHIEWVFDGSGDATFYVDAAIPQAAEDNSGLPKFAWLLESNPMAPPVLEEILDDPVGFAEGFEAVFTHRSDLLNCSVFEYYRFVPGSCTWIEDIRVRSKSKLVSMISSNKSMCDGHNERLRWVQKLRPSVDLYGRGFREIGQKEEGLEDYMFSVAIENDTTPSYFSEKLLDCFATGAVPIYLGTPDIGDFFNPDGIIVLDENFYVGDLSEGLYAEMLPAILDNCDKVKQYRTGEDYIWSAHLEEEYGADLPDH